MLSTTEILNELEKIRMEMNIKPTTRAKPIKKCELTERFQCTEEELRGIEEGRLCEGKVRPYLLYDQYTNRYFIPGKAIEPLPTFSTKITGKWAPYLIVATCFLFFINGGLALAAFLWAYVYLVMSPIENKKASDYRRIKAICNIG